MDIVVVLVVSPIKEPDDVWPMFVYYEFVQNNKNINLYNTQYNTEQLYDCHSHHKLYVTKIFIQIFIIIKLI